MSLLYDLSFSINSVSLYKNYHVNLIVIRILINYVFLFPNLTHFLPKYSFELKENLSNFKKMKRGFIVIQLLPGRQIRKGLPLRR